MPRDTRLVSNEAVPFSRTALAFVLYLALSSGLPYYVLKHQPTPKNDAVEYLAIALDPAEAPGAKIPCRYRVLTPLLAIGVSHLVPMYSVESRADAEISSDVKRLMWSFLVTNYAFSLIGATLCFYYAHAACRIDALPSFVVGTALLFALETVRGWQPLVDVGAQVFVFLGLICYARNKIGWFLLVASIGVLQRESVVLVLGIYLLLEGIRQCWVVVPWLIALAPAVLLYVGFTILFPAVDHWEEMGHAGLGWPSFRTIRHFLRADLAVEFLPLIMALAAHVWLRMKGHRIGFPLEVLLVVPLMLAISVWVQSEGDLWGANVRVAFISFPVISIYLALVLQAACRQLGWLPSQEA